MAPLASDPKELMLVLNPARRRALISLIKAILSHMHDNIQKNFDDPPKEDIAPLLKNSRDSPSSSNRETPPGQESFKPLPEKAPLNQNTLALRRAALHYFDKWAEDVVQQLRKVCEGAEDPRSDQRRKEWQAQHNPPPPPYTATSTSTSRSETQTKSQEEADALSLSTLQSLYPPLPSRLPTIPLPHRLHTLSSILLLLLSSGHYTAHSRILLLNLTSSLSLPLTALTTEETTLSQTLLSLKSQGQTKSQYQTPSATPQLLARQNQNASSRAWKVGLASIAGAAVIGLTGGLAAPVVAGAIGGIMSGVGLGGVASFLGIFAMNGVLVGSLFGVIGGRKMGERMDVYAKEVEDFRFIPINQKNADGFDDGEWDRDGEGKEEDRRLRVCVGVNGWLCEEGDVVRPWRVLGDDMEVFALRYEMASLIDLGMALREMVSSYAWSAIRIEILKRTVLATLWAALWPLALLRLATNIDNPFSIARNRSEKAGRVLADALIERVQGERPVTLIGYSLGGRVVWSCLKELARRREFGIIEQVVFIGAPVPGDKETWREMRAMVSGEVVNVFSERDWVLGVVYRVSSFQMGVAGLQKIEGVEGVRNLDFSRLVSGHLRYPELLGGVLRRAGFEGIKEMVGDEVWDAESEDLEGGDLIDFSEGKETAKFDDTKGGLGLGKKESSVDELTRGLSGLGMDCESSSSALPAFKPQAQPQKPNQDTAVDELIMGIAGMEMNMPDKTLIQPANQSSSQSQNRPQPRIIPEDDGYSSSDDGGIQMMDNDTDSDSELQEIPHEPMPFEDIRETGKVAARVEQKSLGSFPRDRGEGDR